MFINTDVKIAHTENDGFIVQIQWPQDDGTTITKEFVYETFGDLVKRLGHFYGRWWDDSTEWLELTSEQDKKVLIVGNAEDVEFFGSLVADAAFD